MATARTSTWASPARLRTRVSLSAHVQIDNAGKLSEPGRWRGSNASACSWSDAGRLTDDMGGQRRRSTLSASLQTCRLNDTGLSAPHLECGLSNDE